MFDTLKSIEIIENFMQTSSRRVCDDELYTALKNAVEIMESHKEAEYATRRGRDFNTSSRFWKKYNPNPRFRRVGDCAIRACCKATNRTWNEVFDDLVQIAYRQKDVLSSNKVWREYLEDNGYVRYEPDYPMDVYKFCCNFPHGTYVLGLDGHVVTVVDGQYFDTWDSGGKNVIYFWERG